jgi:hypothetical protein
MRLHQAAGRRMFLTLVPTTMALVAATPPCPRAFWSTARDNALALNRRGALLPAAPGEKAEIAHVRGT